MSPCDPGLRAAFALGGVPLLVCLVGVLMVGVLVGILVSHDRAHYPDGRP